MKLSSGLYSDLTKEFIPLLDEDLEWANKFMFSGIESLGALETSIKKAKRILFDHLMECDRNECTRCSLVMKVKFEDNINIDIDLEHPHMEYIVQWVLSSVKKVKVDIKEPLDTNVINALSKNPNFTYLKIYTYDPSAARQLLACKKFDYVQIEPTVFESFDDVHIDTKELKLHGVCLKKLLKAEFIKTTSLNTGFSKQEFDDILFTTEVGSGFQSLEKLELIIRGRDVFNDPQKIFKFLDFLNTKFTNLKLVLLDYNEFHQLFYEADEGHFNLPPDSVKNIVKYQDKLDTYNGKIKVKLNHNISFNVISSPEKADEDYVENLKKELKKLEYSCCIKDFTTYRFKKSNTVAENLEVNILLWLTHWIG